MKFAWALQYDRFYTIGLFFYPFRTLTFPDIFPSGIIILLGKREGERLKKRTIILYIAVILVLAVAAFLGFRFYQHEKAQNDELRALQSRQSAALATAEELSARLTRLELKSDYTEDSYKYFPLGNSITVHAPNEVWWNEVGMAASDADHDFVHLVADYLSASHGKVVCHPYYFCAWETAEDRASKLFLLDPYLDAGLDLVTIQLGENAENLSTSMSSS